MQPTVLPVHIFRFGLFEADVARNTLTRNGVRVKIQDQPFRVLVLLLERPGEIVSREELRQSLWPEGTYVDFDGSLNVILKKLRAAIDDDPDNPRFIETVPRRGYRFIAPVAVKNGAADSTVPHSGLVSGDRTQPAGARHRSLYLRLTYALPVLVLAVASSSAWFVWHGGRTPSRTASASHAASVPVQPRKSLAVLGFQNLSGRPEDAWLAMALSEMLSTELAGGEKLRLVSGEDVANLRLSSPWAQTGTLDQKTTERLGRALSSDVLVLGSYTKIGKSDRGQLRVDVRLQDAKSGEILTEIAEIGSSQDLFRLISRVGARLRERLGVPRLEDAQQASVLAALPLDPEAARFYALGVAKLRQFDALAAKDLLQQAAKADPKFSLVHAMLARAWAQLGYEQKHKQEAKTAFDLSADLPRADRMLVEGEYYESLGDQEQAASVYHALFELFPDNVEYGLRLAAAQTFLGHGSQAMEVVHQLRSLPAPSSDDPRIDLAEARAMKDNKPAALALVRSAMRKASAREQKLLYALARKEECMNLLYRDEPSQAVPSCEEAYNIFLSAGNRLGAADAIRLTADGLGAEGHFEQAIATYQRALDVLKGMQEYEKTGAIVNNMAINFANEGKLDRAEQLYEQAKSDFLQAGDKLNTATAMENIADILYLKGNLPGAAKLYHQTLDFIATIDHAGPGYSLYRLADLQLAQGNVKDAQRLAQEAIESIRPTQGSYQYLTGAMIELGEALEAKGDLAGARSQFEETLAIRQKMGELALAAESQLELAGLAIQEGHPDLAESLARTALAQFEKEKGDPDSSSAYTALSRALLMQGRMDEARAAAVKGMALSRTSADPALRLPAAIQQARVEMARPGPGGATSAAALRELRATIAAAQKLGYYEIECEAQLALGELELRSNSSSGHKHLTALASETRSHGLELLARQAEDVMAGASDLVARNRSAH